jgi:hypothetical protein
MSLSTALALKVWEWWQKAVVSRSVRPEVAAKLNEGFSARVERRRRQYAVRIHQAEGNLAAEHLGALVGIYHQRGGRSRPRGQHEWAYAGQDGLMLEHSNPSAAQVIRWDLVASVFRVWGEHYHPGISEDSAYRLLDGHRLVMRDGREFALSVAYANVLDPYRNVGRFIAATMPANAGATVPRFPTLGEVVEQALTRQLLPSVQHDYERGLTLQFGPLSVDRGGLRLADDAAVLAWQDLDEVASVGPVLAIMRNGMREPWRTLDVTDIPNFCVLEALLATLTEQR